MRSSGQESKPAEALESMLWSLEGSVQVRNLHKVTQPEDRRATPESHPESNYSPPSTFLLLADTKGKMRKYSMEDELTSEA